MIKFINNENYNNQIISNPNTILDLKNLKYIDLSNNPIEEGVEILRSLKRRGVTVVY